MTGIPSIIWLPEAQSTNSIARERIQELDNLSVVATSNQTSGRGQGDHLWHSEPGKNFTGSIALKGSRLPAREEPRISQAAACAVCAYLQTLGIEAGIKLPNDIWVDGKKICGILIEHSVMEGIIEWTIVGIGLNLNQTEFPSDLPNPVSVKQLTGLETEPRQAALNIQEQLGRMLALPASELAELFESSLI